MMEKPCRCGKIKKNFKMDIGPFFIAECCIEAGYNNKGEMVGKPKKEEKPVEKKVEEPKAEEVKVEEAKVEAVEEKPVKKKATRKKKAKKQAE